MGIRTLLGLRRPLAERMAEQATRQAQLETHRRLRQMLSSLRPLRAVGFDKIRVGRAHDGGYVMLDDFSGIGTAFSCGIGGDCSWDSMIAGRGIPVHQFDHTVEGSPQPDPLFTFHKLAVAGQSGDGRITIPQIASMAGSQRSILKLDIEGHEWPALMDMKKADLSPFAQIVVEFHRLRYADRTNALERYEKTLRNLAEGFQCVHVHGNNAAPYVVLCNIPLPDVLEVTFASRARYRFAETDEIFPTPLDMPNKKEYPDLCLGSFKFG